MTAKTALGPVTRDDIEAALWRWSGWKADQVLVDALLDHVDRYVTGDVVELARTEAAQILQSARDEAEAMRPPPAICPSCEAAIAEAKAARETAAATAAKKRIPRQRVPETDRRCQDCERVKGIDRFNKDVKARNGRKPMCKDCEAVRRAARPTVAKATGRRPINIKVAA